MSRWISFVTEPRSVPVLINFDQAISISEIECYPGCAVVNGFILRCSFQRLALLLNAEIIQPEHE